MLPTRSQLPWTTFPLSIILSLVLGFIGPFSLIQPASAEESLIRTLTVRGQGSIYIPTTKVAVTLGVEVQGRTATEVQQMTAQKSAAIVNLLRSRNVEKLQTTGIRLNPRYRYDQNVQFLEGFTALNQVSFQVPIEEAGKLMDEAVEIGASQINNIQFIAADAAIDQARQQALQEATQNAQRQAQTVLSSLNLSPQEIISIQVDGAQSPYPLQASPRAASISFSDVRESTPIVGAEQEVQASVTLQIRY